MFDKYPIVETVAGFAKITDSDGKCTVELSEITDDIRSVDIAGLLPLLDVGSSVEILFKNGDTLSFSYLETLKLSEYGVHTLSLDSIFDTYILKFYSKDGSAITDEVKATVSASCSVGDPENAVLYYRDSGEKKYVRNTCADGKITFTAPQGTYYAGVAYSLTSVVPESMKLILNKQLASEGEVVKVSLDVNPGIRVDRVYIVGQDNVKHYIDGMTTDGKLFTVSGSFKMPAQDITVGVEYMQLLYTVKFVSDGKIISSEKYNYGDTVSVPSDPVKASDEKYSYKFIGWTPSVEAVTEDVVYKANYETILLPPKSNDNMKLSPLVVKLLLLLYVGASCFTFLVIPSAVLSIILVVRYKKQRVKVKLKNKRQ